MYELPKNTEERGVRILRRYTADEIKTIKEMVFDGKRRSEISASLNRTNSSIDNVLARLGLTKPVGTNQYSFGTSAVNGMKGKHHKEEAKLKIAESRKKYIMDRHPGWKGGKRMNENGYFCIRFPNHPRAVNGYVFEHVLVMESILKRYLNPHEVVHHINEIKTDNRPQNLMVFNSDNDHKHYHSFMRMEMEFNA